MPPVTRNTARLVIAMQYRPVVIRRGYPATTKVFNIAEMLIMILENLSHLHLTRCERVHPVWREIILTAPELQEQRFSRAKTTSEVIASNARRFTTSHPNRTEFHLQIRIVHPPAEVKNLNLFTICDLHPAFTAIQNDCLAFGIRAATILGWEVPGPWQDQFIMQPPFPAQHGHGQAYSTIHASEAKAIQFL